MEIVNYQPEPRCVCGHYADKHDERGHHCRDWACHCDEYRAAADDQLGSWPPLADDECPWCGEVECDETCSTALTAKSEDWRFGRTGRDALG